ncbi:MAG: HNH endonuclease [Desulfitobacteriaceae bacterium]
MPTRANRPCKQRGCPNLTRDISGYCGDHRQIAIDKSNAWKAQLDRHRGSARERGYDGTWKRLRKMYLREHPLCEDCLEQGRLEPATEVHHKEKVREHPELRLAISNLRALSKECHSRRTARGE